MSAKTEIQEQEVTSAEYLQKAVESKFSDYSAKTYVPDGMQEEATALKEGKVILLTHLDGNQYEYLVVASFKKGKYTTHLLKKNGEPDNEAIILSRYLVDDWKMNFPHSYWQ